MRHAPVLRANRSTGVKAVADRLTPAMRKRFLAAINAIKSQVDLDELAAALDMRDLTKVLDALHFGDLPDELADAAGTIAEAFAQAGHLTAAELEQMGIEEALVFNITNPRAIQWMQHRGAQLVVDIENDTRQMIRDLVATGLGGEATVDETARALRSYIGLTDRLAGAVTKYRAELLRRGGRTLEQIEAKAEKYAAQLLNYRARLIARTETMAGAANGQLEAWRQAADQNLLQRERTHRVWNTSELPNVCPICDPMDGQEVGFDESFTTGDGDKVMTAPVHPACACDVSLRFV